MKTCDVIIIYSKNGWKPTVILLYILCKTAIKDNCNFPFLFYRWNSSRGSEWNSVLGWVPQGSVFVSLVFTLPSLPPSLSLSFCPSLLPYIPPSLSLHLFLTLLSISPLPPSHPPSPSYLPPLYLPTSLPPPFHPSLSTLLPPSLTHPSLRTFLPPFLPLPPSPASISSIPSALPPPSFSIPPCFPPISTLLAEYSHYLANKTVPIIPTLCVVWPQL